MQNTEMNKCRSLQEQKEGNVSLITVQNSMQNLTQNSMQNLTQNSTQNFAQNSMRNEGISSAKEEETGVRLSQKEAEAYRAYKRTQKLLALKGVMEKSATQINCRDDVGKLLANAKRFRQIAVKITPPLLGKIRKELKNSKVLLDCVVGGNGETLSKAKIYEAKRLRRLGADELTLVISPSLLFEKRYAEIIKEVKGVKRVGRGAKIKVWVDKGYPFYVLAYLARALSERGIDYFSVPYFDGCERLRYDLFRGCDLEVCDVDRYEDFRKMARAGVGRIVTSCILELRERWIKELEEELM